MSSNRPTGAGAALRRWRSAPVSISFAACVLFAVGLCSPAPAIAAGAGTLDPDFGSFPGSGRQTFLFDLGGSFEDSARALAVQPDGKVVAAGFVDRGTTDEDFAVVRFDADGELDPGFGAFPGLGKMVIAFDLGQDDQDAALAVAIQADGKIVVGGYAQTANAGDNAMAVARLLANGFLDSSFGSGGTVTVTFDVAGTTGAIVRDLAIQPDGKIVLAGVARTQLAPPNADFAVVRLLPDGTLDPTFGTGGKKTVVFDLGGNLEDVASSVVVQPDGKIVVAGSASNAAGFQWAVARLTASGSLDATFDVDGRQTIDLGPNGSALDLALQSDGRIVGAGVGNGTATIDFGVVRLLPNGTLDSSFDGDGKTTVAFEAGGSNQDFGYALAIQPNGKIVLGGQVYKGTGDRDFGVARLLPNGAPDPGFGSGGKTLVGFDLGNNNDDKAFALAIRPDSRIVVAGSVQRTASGDTDLGIAQLLGDQVFADGFESGGLSAWSGVAP